ncbi:MAG: exo-alpha-sialidase [Pseudomonadota bacterium]
MRHLGLILVVLGVLAPSVGFGGDALTSLRSPAVGVSAQPHLATSADGTVILSWLEHEGETETLRFASLGEGQWNPPRTVATGTRWFVNWADFPSVEHMGGSRLAAHWLKKSADSTYAYDVMLSLSDDSGQHWSEPFSPHTDETPTEHGFVSMVPDGDDVGVLWLDGRNTGGHGHSHDQHGTTGGMTLRYATVNANGERSNEALVDNLVCDCCQTDAVSSEDGPIAVYRNRTESETRDTFITRRVNGTWQSGQAVVEENWVIDGCPVNGPALDALDQHVAVAWFTAIDEVGSVSLALSDDGGRRFEQHFTVDDNNPVGRVSVVILPDRSVVIGWIRRASASRGEFVVQRFHKDAKPSAPMLIAELATARRAGFPQMTLHDQSLVFAWIQTANDSTSIQTAVLPISALENT